MSLRISKVKKKLKKTFQKSFWVMYLSKVTVLSEIKCQQSLSDTADVIWDLGTLMRSKPISVVYY